MRALTIRQPWAEMIMCGAKTVEYRSMRGPVGERIAIHAGSAEPQAEMVQDAWEWLGREGLHSRAFMDWAREQKRGVVLGTALVAGCRRVQEGERLASFGQFVWELAEVQEWSCQERARGQLGLWDLDKGIEQAREWLPQ